MAPKIRTTPIAATATTTLVTDAQLKALIEQGVAEALTARDRNNHLNGDGSQGSGSGTEGVTGLTQWFERMETVFDISNCAVENQVKFVACTLHDPIEQLTKEFHTKAANEINNSSLDHYKAVYADKKTPHDNGQHEVSFDNCTQIVQEKVASLKVLPCKLSPKEMNPRNFMLPYTIESLKFYAMADLGASVKVIPNSMFEHLKLAQLKKTDMLVEMEDITKRTPIKIVENVLVKIDKFLFPSDFVVMDMLKTHNETMILRRPFLATIHAEIDVFKKEISLELEVTEFEEWCNNNLDTPPTSRFTTIQKNLNPRPKDYPFKDWLLTKEDLVKDPRERSFDDYKWMFDLEIDQWHDQKSKEEERQELGINIEEFDPPIVHIETFEIKRYSFDSGQNFICVTKELMDALPLGRENEARFRDMIRKEVDSGRRIHRKT
ncbi:RNA-directed DNA polymerase, eukaryota, reverse transcriptase zinc-binding domain protein [Tanacetum coccineum]